MRLSASSLDRARRDLGAIAGSGGGGPCCIPAVHEVYDNYEADSLTSPDSPCVHERNVSVIFIEHLGTNRDGSSALEDDDSLIESEECDEQYLGIDAPESQSGPGEGSARQAAIPSDHVADDADRGEGQGPEGGIWVR